MAISQMVVLAITIDIGGPAVTGISEDWPNVTCILKNNPANATGKITTIEIYAYSTLSNMKVAIFENVSGNYFTTRSIHTIGTVTGGEKTIVPVDLNVTIGDFIGFIYTAGQMSYTQAGIGYWYSPGDHIPCTNTIFTSYTSSTLYSLYGTGATEEEANVIFFGTNF